MYALKSKITRVISSSCKNDNLKDIHIEIEKSSAKGDGYVGDVVFAKVTSTTSDNQIRVLDLVLKCGKASEKDKQTTRDLFERESLIYTTVFEKYRALESVYGLDILRGVLPQCFGTLLPDSLDPEVIVLENLRTLGYDLHDKQTALDMAHLKLTLPKYGQWHALSLAFQEKNPSEYDELSAKLESVSEAAFPLIKVLMEASEKLVFEEVESHDTELAKRLRKKIPDSFVDVFMSAMTAKENVNVLRHGDCWNNNFMFKYDDNLAPTNVKFLDFQISNMGPPVTDLVYHIYGTASEVELSNFEELLQLYYSTFATILRRMDCDPEKLFPYEELVRQWKKYASFGLVMLGLVMSLIFNTTKVGGMEDMNADSIAQSVDVAKKDHGQAIRARILAVVKHLFDFEDS